MKNLLLDEHMPPLYRRQLLRRRPHWTVWQIGDEGAPPTGTSDPDILRWCEENDFVLITNNRTTMPVHLRDHLEEGHHAPGILTIDLEARIGLILEDILIVLGASGKEEYRDLITYIPLR